MQVASGAHPSLSRRAKKLSSLFILGASFLMSLSVFGQTSTTGGSGFVVTPDGYILTAYHVVADASGTIQVILADRKEYPARLIDYSPTFEEGGYDLALLKIDAAALPTLPLGDSDTVQLFDRVIAMGYPLAFELGVRINATGGNITAFRTLEEGPAVFQIDAAINPGNSGGPVLELGGAAIGVAVARVTEVGDTAVAGVSFVVPIANAIDLLVKNIPGWAQRPLNPAAVPSQEIVKAATPAVVYIQWNETSLKGGVYMEDFSTKKAWFAGVWNSSGFVEITETAKNKVRKTSCPSNTTVAFYEVDVVFTAHENGGAGLAFESSQEGKWSFLILFDPDGFVGVFSMPRGGETWRPIRDWRKSGSIHVGLRVVNHLKVEVGDRNTLLYFNDGEPVGVNAVVPLGGTLQLVVANFKGTTTVRFDNLYLHEEVTPAILR